MVLPKFSPDGKHLTYAAKNGKKLVVVVDGQPAAEYDEIFGYSPIFSPDGKHLAYVARKGEKWLIVVDGQPGAEYDECDYPDLQP